MMAAGGRKAQAACTCSSLNSSSCSLGRPNEEEEEEGPEEEEREGEEDDEEEGGTAVASDPPPEPFFGRTRNASAMAFLAASASLPTISPLRTRDRASRRMSHRGRLREGGCMSDVAKESSRWGTTNSGCPLSSDRTLAPTLRMALNVAFHWLAYP